MFRNPEYMNFQKDYQANLMGSYLCGEDEIFHSLYFCERELYDKYHGRVPSRAALGDALSVAYAVLREERRNKAS